MAKSMLSSKTIRSKQFITSLFLHLPSSYRSFHASSVRHDITSIIGTTSELMQCLHTTTHLPWVLALPLTAVLVRMTVVLPMSLYTRRAQQRQLDLQPIMQAWQRQIRAKVMREKRHLGPEIVIRDEAKALRFKRRELYKRWNCGFWTNYLPFLQLPVFLLVIESIRSLSGAKRGLLGLIWIGVGTSDGITDSRIEDRIEANTAVGMNTAVEDSGNIAIEATSLPTTTIDHTMVTEGALWFPDLTAADPMLILPFVLSGTMLLNIFSSSKRGVEQTLVQKRIMRALGVVALAAGPLTLQLPSGMLVYWITSSLTAYAQATALDRFMPLKRPLMLKSTPMRKA